MYMYGLNFLPPHSSIFVDNAAILFQISRHINFR